MNNGIATDKNMLGADCLILGFFFFWYLLQTWKSERSIWRRNELRLIAGFLIGIWWLFSQAHSATSVISLIVGSTDSRVCRHPFYKQEFHWDVPVSSISSPCRSRSWHLGFQGICPRLWVGAPSLSGRTELWTALLELAYQSDSWDGI